MFCKLMTVLVLVAGVAYAAENQTQSLVDQHRIAFQLVFEDGDQPLEVHTTKFQLSRLKRMQTEAKAQKIELTDDDESFLDMLSYLVEVSHVTKEKCYGDSLAESELLTGYLKNLRNIVNYLDYYNQKQLELCHSLGIELHV